MLAHLVSSPQPLANEILAFPERVFRLSVMPSNENRSRYGKDKIGGLILKEKSHGHLRWHPSGCQNLLKNFRSIRCCLVTQSCPTLAIPWTRVLQAPPSMRFPRQEYWTGLPFPPPGDLPSPGIEPESPAFAGRFLTTEHVERPASG